MCENLQLWQLWVRNLHRWGIYKMVASFTEMAESMDFIGASLIYWRQPFLKYYISN